MQELRPSNVTVFSSGRLAMIPIAVALGFIAGDAAVGGTLPSDPVAPME